MEFRKDINGLRAIAVLSVILFHFNKEWVPGGFAGVDIFFVISGFLMTKIILSKIGCNSFSFVNFYSARAKRIIPSLTATSLIVLILGYLFLSPKDYLRMSQDALSSITFVSNFWFASQSGYFDTSSNENFFLHTWSLSVEWQFYIIYPVILYCLYRLYGMRTSILSIYLMLAISFVVGFYYTFYSATYAYYMFPLRAWEMLAGGICFLQEKKTNNKRYSLVFEVSGALLIAFSLFYINDLTPWPGYMSIIPVLGTSLILLSNNQSSLLTSGKLQQLIGKVSYSAYLIHWPVLVLIWKLGVTLNVIAYLLIISSASILLYLCFERSKRINFKNCAFYIVTVTAGFSVYASNGYEARVPPEFRLTQREFHWAYYGGAGYPADKVFYSQDAKDNYDFIFAGDSFAAQYAKEIDKSGIKAAELYIHGCPLFPEYSRYSENRESSKCSAAFDDLIKLLNKNRNATLVYSLAWDNYKDIIIKKGSNKRQVLTESDYEKLIADQIQKLIAIGGNQRKYFFIGRPMDTSKSGFNCISGARLLGYKIIGSCKEEQEFKKPLINDIVKSAVMKYDNIKFIDPNDFLCKNNKCLFIVRNQPIYSDLEHLSICGSEIVFKGVMKIIDN